MDTPAPDTPALEEAAVPHWEGPTEGHVPLIPEEVQHVTQALSPFQGLPQGSGVQHPFTARAHRGTMPWGCTTTPVQPALRDPQGGT